MLHAIQSRQKDLPAMLGIGIGLIVIGLVPRWFFAEALGEEMLYTTQVLGQVMLAIMPVLVAGYLFTDTLMRDRYLDRSQRAGQQWFMAAAFCLFYLLLLAWLWFFVKPGELLIFDRAIVLLFVAALFLEWPASLGVGGFAVVVRLGLLLLLDPGPDQGAVLTATTLSIGEWLATKGWIYYEPGVWGLATALLLGIACRRYYHRRPQQSYPLWLGFLCGVVMEGVYLGAVYWHWEDWPGFMDLSVNYTVPNILGVGATTMLLILLMAAASTEAERQRAQAAELLYLQSQINPHFLFNALATIQGLTYEHPEKARALLAHLGDMYEVIARHRHHLIPLEQELEHVQSYLLIAKERWPGRLTIHQSIAPTVDRQQPVPALILQPIVENAVEHGLVPKREGGILEISIEEKPAVTLIVVRDDGMGILPPENRQARPGQRAGIGLQNVIRRMQTLYGAAYVPQVESQQGKGTAVTITIPKKQDESFTHQPNW
jgi:anti-sigma regulatory factor (Ser/Thr protein kinase)